jgi:hypothetical protein
MSSFLVLLYLVAGSACLTRPALIVKWIATLLKSAGSSGKPAWLQGRGVVLIIRLIGFLALINAVTYLYLGQNTPQTITH